jgi:hypothetical protein
MITKTHIVLYMFHNWAKSVKAAAAECCGQMFPLHPHPAIGCQ